MTVQELVQKKRGEILDIAARHGARNVRLFGSAARGEADAASDLDFLVEMEPGRSLLDMGGLLMDLRELLGARWTSSPSGASRPASESASSARPSPCEGPGRASGRHP